MLPRLPNELPPPARASASPGDSASARAAKPASRIEVRRIGFRFDVVTAAIWCARPAKARGHAGTPTAALHATHRRASRHCGEQPDAASPAPIRIALTRRPRKSHETRPDADAHPGRRPERPTPDL